MYIKAINWINKDIHEAEVLVSDNSFELLCFSHPLKKTLNEELEEPIYCLNASDVMLTSERKPYIKKQNNTYDYALCGELINKNDKVVLLGSFKLCLNSCYIPNDIKNGDYIEFYVSRLDVF